MILRLIAKCLPKKVMFEILEISMRDHQELSLYLHRELVNTSFYIT